MVVIQLVVLENDDDGDDGGDDINDSVTNQCLR